MKSTAVNMFFLFFVFLFLFSLPFFLHDFTHAQKYQAEVGGEGPGGCVANCPIPGQGGYVSQELCDGSPMCGGTGSGSPPPSYPGNENQLPFTPPSSPGGGSSGGLPPGTIGGGGGSGVTDCVANGSCGGGSITQLSGTSYTNSEYRVAEYRSPEAPLTCPTQSPTNLQLTYGTNGTDSNPTVCLATYNATATWTTVLYAGSYKLIIDDGSGKKDSGIVIFYYNPTIPSQSFPATTAGCTGSDNTKSACAIIPSFYYAHIYGLTTTKTYHWSVAPIGVTNSGGPCVGTTAGPTAGTPFNFTCTAACTDSACGGGGTTASGGTSAGGTSASSGTSGTSGTSSTSSGSGGSTATGGIYIDNDQSNCSDNIAYSGTAFNMSLTGSYSQGAASYAYNGTAPEINGAFSFSNLIGNGTYTITPVLTALKGYKVESISASGSVPITFSYPSGKFILPDDTSTAPQNVSGIRVCLAIQKPWFQTSNGDVRMDTVKDDLPDSQFASTDSSNPSVFISNDGTANFGTGKANASHSWIVNNEFTGNSGLSNLGSTSYDFYVARAASSGIKPTDLGTACSAGNCGSLPTGVYQSSGDFILSNLTVPTNAHITLLIDGDLTINANNPISVSKGSLLIVAVKGNITINQNVGVTPTSTTPSLEGIYTAEGSILMPKGASCPSTEDKRLNVAGALIANSLNPFAKDETGKVSNSRDLCVDNGTSPSLSVTPRLDFITSLTDFYKSTTKSLQEVNP